MRLPLKKKDFGNLYFDSKIAKNLIWRKISISRIFLQFFPFLPLSLLARARIHKGTKTVFLLKVRKCIIDNVKVL